MANQKQELPMAAMFVNGSVQNEQSLYRTFHRCFLPSFTSLGWGVSEEKIKMWKVNGRQTPSDGKSSHYLWHGKLKIRKKHTCIFIHIILTMDKCTKATTWKIWYCFPRLFHNLFCFNKINYFHFYYFIYFEYCIVHI